MVAGDKSTRDDRKQGQPSLVPGVVLLAVAAVLIVLLIINPDMPPAARRTIAGVSIAVVIALLGYAGWVFSASAKRGRR